MNDFLTTLLNNTSFATGSGNETVHAGRKIGISFDRGPLGTLPHKVDPARALSGILTSHWLDEGTFELRVMTAFTGGAGTMDIQLVTADDAALTANRTIINSTGAQAPAFFTLGKLIRWDTRGFKLRRHIGVWQIVAAAAFTAGVAWLGLTDKPFQGNPPENVGDAAIA